ncbi:hypothetical protein [Microbaculum sp. FT89]|uniref:hypothetical protein n=1 Tax=Microbaculum sp. FT89 TaxID=3447298 RepID=UPI003F533901
MTTSDDKPDVPDKPSVPATRSGAGREIAHVLDPDYEAILAAVTETARGRWFLDEYARRNRTADTRALLSALQRLEKSIARPAAQAPAPELDAIARELEGLRDIVGRARVEIAAVPRYNEDGALRRSADGVDFVSESECGKSAALQAHEAAERIQETVWSLRERQVSAELCDMIDRHAVDIQAACRDVTVAFKGMDTMGRALRQLDIGIAGLLDTVSLQAEPQAEPDTPDIFAEDPAVGRFLEDVEDIEIVDVTEVEWHADDGLDEPAQPPPERPGGTMAAQAGDLAFDDADPAAPAGSTDHGEHADLEAPAPEGPAAPEVPAALEVPGAPEGPAAPIAEDPALSEPAEGGHGASPGTGVGNVQTIPAQPGPKAHGRTDPPADLTGLTFDQKMILFS